MNHKDFISELAQVTDHSAKDTQILVHSLIAEMTELLEDENQILVPNFGSFEVRKKLERVVFNPGTGQRMLVPPKLVLNFKASSILKERIQKGGEV